FFFQAEDGIRDRNVTGVQTCALPIWAACRPVDGSRAWAAGVRAAASPEKASSRSVSLRTWLSSRLTCSAVLRADAGGGANSSSRSEERRVGKECRCECGGDDENRNKT